MNKKLIIKLILFFLITLILLSFNLFKKISVDNVETGSTTLNNTYLKVLINLGKKSSFEEILSSNNSKLLEKNWDNFEFNLERPIRIRTWNLDAKGHFTIQTNSKDIKEDLEILQEIKMSKKEIIISNKLKEESTFIKKFNTKIKILDTSPVSLVLENQIVYSRTVPIWLEDNIKKRVEDYNKSYIENNINTIKKICEKN